MNRYSDDRSMLIALAVSVLLLAVGSDAIQAGQRARSQSREETDYRDAVRDLRNMIDLELERGILTGVSVALIDETRIVLADGFGWADKEKETRATSETVYRVGSISKLFTALGIMQLVDQGTLDLDVPVSRYLPNFRITNPFDSAESISLRQLMCHRSGLVRESPIGGYFDGSEASLAESIASLGSCVLVNPPNTKTRYSNIGVTVVGQAIEAVSGQSFEQYQQDHLLRPIGMVDSGWHAKGTVRRKLAAGYMRVADGRGGFVHQRAPTFELGTIPAGNLYSNVTDLARFAMMLLGNGTSAGRRVISDETLDAMSLPQLTDDETGYGLGFYVGRHRDHKTIRHSGAVYGFSASIVVLRDARIAVVVLANEDIVPGPVKKIIDAALDLMLKAKTGEAPPQPTATKKLGLGELSTFAGEFESPGYWADVAMQDDRLTVDVSGQPLTLRPVASMEFEANGRWAHRAVVKFRKNDQGEIAGFSAFGQQFDRVAANRQIVPSGWRQYLGSYGPAYIPLVVSVRHGHLYAMTENMVDYRLTPVNQSVFKMPPGLYDDEYLVFERDSKGHVHGVTLANMPLPRLQKKDASSQ